MNNKLAYFSATLFAFIIGLSFVFMKVALKYTNPLNILAHRFTIAFFTFLIPVLCRWTKIEIKKSDIKNILPLAIFSPMLFFAFQVYGLSYISSTEAGIIHAIVPVITLIISSVFLKEKSSSIEKISIILSVSGVIFIFIMKGINVKSANLLGIFLILLSVLSASIYTVLARKTVQKYNFVDVTYVMIFLGFISFNALSLIDNIYRGDMGLYFKPFSNLEFTISIVFLGVLSSTFTSILSNYALSKISAPKMSVFNNLSTLITIIAGILFLEENIYYYHVIGGLFIILGVIGTNISIKLNHSFIFMDIFVLLFNRFKKSFFKI